jgi:lambda family phage portal protein
MSLFNRIRAAGRALFSNPPQGRRSFAAAQLGRLYSDWIASATSSDAEIRGSIRRLIDRSRSLERDNDYQRGFLLACERNIIGAIRSDLRMDCGEYIFGAPDKAPEWKSEKGSSARIEQAWSEWGKRGTCTVCGRYSWRDVKRMMVRSTARDGNFLARKVYGRAARNRFGFALQIFEIDHLDIDRFGVERSGNEVRFGIEMDPSNRVVAYWIRARHPGDLYAATGTSSQVLRIPAEEMRHIFLPDRAEQSIGFPWIVSAITRLRQLGAFEEAATIAARIGASKAGFFKKTPDGNGAMGEWEGETNGDGRAIMDASPGTFEELPQGWSLDQWNPEYPNIETGDFRKAMLRGVGTSVGMSYTTLGNDLESVNFSSARVGLFEEREGWKALQCFFSEVGYEPIFGDFLVAFIGTGTSGLPANALAQIAKYERPVFKARRWPFIDPLKEVEAARTGIALRLTSRRQVVEETGGDIEDVMHDNFDDEKLAKDIGLSLSPPDPMPEAFGETDPKAAGGQPAKPPPEEKDDEDADE